MKNQVEGKTRIPAAGRANVHEKGELKLPVGHARNLPARPDLSVNPRQTEAKPEAPVRDSSGSATDEDIARADGEGMAPVPVPRAHPAVKGH